MSKLEKHANEFLESGLNKRVDKHEEDRIGRGKIAKTAAKALGSIPFTDLGSNIGGECSSNCVKKRLSPNKTLSGKKISSCEIVIAQFGIGIFHFSVILFIAQNISLNKTLSK